MNCEQEVAPVVVLGAARSGTKLLRSIVAAADEFKPVPHDVNYLWHYSARRVKDDLISALEVTPKARTFIRKHLERMAGLAADDHQTFVEKTVSNTLRVPLVRAVLPDARFIHLVRGGEAVTESAMRCWQAPPDYRRLLSKLKNYPWLAGGGYLQQYTRGWVTRYASGSKRLPSWGPRYTGIDEDVATRSLAEVCARQWRFCVDRARHDLTSIPASRWIEIQYEDLAADPESIGKQIGAFLEVRVPDKIVQYARENVRPQQSRRLTGLSSDQQKAVEAILNPANRQTEAIGSTLAA